MHCPLCTTVEVSGATSPEQGWLILGYWLAYRFPDAELCLQHMSVMESVDKELLGGAVRTSSARILKLVKASE
jgi:hypothetical protein